MVISEISTEERLADVDWDGIYRSLLKYTKIKVYRLHWPLGPEVLPSGYDAEALAQESILRLLNGERNWDVVKFPDLLDFLKASVIDSLVSHLRDRVELKKTAPLNEAGELLLESEPISLPAENSEYTSLLANAIVDASSDDEELSTVVECLLEDIIKPREIAQKMGLTPREASRIKERLKAKCTRIRDSVRKSLEEATK